MLKRFAIAQNRSPVGFNAALSANSILENRYRIVRELGAGGFGRTYLAEDMTRFDEQCVVKEFAPQVQGVQALSKAKELFRREAGVLYRLQHPQIPRFRELMQARANGNLTLFLVQDYIPGQTYSQLLKARLAQGERFKELEVRQLLAQVLPTLEYLHGEGTIHRDLSPDNLMRRDSDGLTFLIDFGAVKQVANTAVRRLTPLKAGPTQIHKPGYSPPEQKQGQAYENSDLYALAVTALVLLTGEHPQALYDSYTATWRWQNRVSLSPNLTQVLMKMLAHQPSDRYPSARAVFEALNLYHLTAPQATPVSVKVAPSPVTQVSQVATVNVVGRPLPPPIAIASPAPQSPVQASPSPIQRQMLGVLGWPFKLVWVLLRGGVKLGLLGLFLLLIGFATTRIPRFVKPAIPTIGLSEEQRRDRLHESYAQLEVAGEFWIALVNEVFYAQHPQSRGRQLDPNAPEDAPLRQRWIGIGEEILNQVERAQLSVQAREQLGRYSARDYDRWQAVLSEGEMQKLNERANERFERLFPQQQGKAIAQTRFEQIWYAIAADEFAKLQP